MPVIKVMADYESYPLWKRNTGGIVNIDPRELPITSELAKCLMDWADEYDATLDRSDPLSSGFLDATAEDAFYERGRRLADRLATELRGDYTVEFFDGDTTAQTA